MNKINVGKVVIGGLVAGLIVNVGEFLLNGVLLADAIKQDFAKLGLGDPGSNTTFLVRVISITFLLGIAIVYLYAAIRPRFGAGWKTAACAGVVAWFFVCLYAGYVYLALGIGSSKVYLIALVWCFAEYVIAAIAGAYFYKEE